MNDDEIVAVAKRFDDAMMSFFELMKSVERRDPHFMGTMRKYGLIQASQALVEVGGEAIAAFGKALAERTPAPPTTLKERAQAVVERVKRDRTIMAQQRAAGTMSEADYITAMRELDAISAQATEWTG